MRKTVSIMITLLLLLPTALFAAGAEEAVVDIEAIEGETQFEGVREIDRASGWSEGRSGGRIVIPELNSGPRTLNRIISTETSSTNILDQMYDSLIDRNQFTLEPEADLAESYTISADGRTVTFTIPSGLVWSDGDDLTAKDFVFSYNHMVLREDVLGNLRSVKLMVPPGESVAVPFDIQYIDDTTLSVTLPDVSANLLIEASLTPFPMHIFAPVIGWDEATHGLDYEYEIGTDEEGNEILVEIKPDGVDYTAVNSFWGIDTPVSQIVGNGPYVIDRFVPDQRIVMVPNENYWKTDDWGNQLPYLNEVVFEFIEDQDTMLQRFLAGEIDTLGVRGQDYASLVDRQEELDFSMWNIGPSPATLFIAVNQNPIEGEDDGGLTEPELTWQSNRTFRTALAHLVDRQTVINNIVFGFGYEQYGPIPPGTPFYWEGIEDAAPQFDPAEASRLLDSIDYTDKDGDGWRDDPDGNRITLEVATNAGNNTREAMAELFAQEAQNVGLDIQFTTRDFNALVGQLLTSFDYQMIIIGLTSGDPDPTSTGVYPSSGNLHMIEPYQTSPRRDWEARVDELHAAQRRELDVETRKEMWVELQQIWLEELPMIYTFTPALMGAIKNEFGNYLVQGWQGRQVRDIIEYLYVK